VIQYDPRALFQIQRRAIEPERVVETLERWDETEVRGDKRSYLRCYPERAKMLRVVVRESDHAYVITAYYDRRKPCG
jgi:hypothetical protein